MTRVIEKPVFFVGCPRSGTTVIFEAASRHERLGWPTNYSEMLPAVPALNLLRRVLDNQWWAVTGRKRQHGRTVFGNRYLPQPDEAYRFWNTHAGASFAGNYLQDEAASDAVVARVRDAVSKTLFWQGRARFSAKLTGPTRMHFLHSIFPDARFVHIVRDGRAVVRSLLRVGFWREGGGLERPFWQGGLGENDIRQWQDAGSDPGILAAMQWKKIIEVAWAERESLDAGQYLEVRYEDFVADPHGVLRGIFAFSQLDDSQRAHEYVTRGPELRNRNLRGRDPRDAEYDAVLYDAMEPVISRLGYRP